MRAQAYLAFLGFAMWRTYGMYHPWLVPLFAAWTVAEVVLFFQGPKKVWSSGDAGLFPVLLFFAGLLAWSPALMYAHNNLALAVLRSLCGALPVLVLLEWVTLRTKRAALSGWIGRAVLGVLVFCQVLVPLASPNPFIDVFTLGTDAADYLLKGQNPYLGQYKDIYNGGYSYPPTFAYLPGQLYAASIVRAVFGDIRYLYVASNLVTAFLLWRFSRRRHLAALWLLFPVQLFVLEQAWVDSFMVPFALLAFAYAEKKRLWPAVGAAAYWFSVKQFAFLGVILAALLGRKKSGGHWALKFFVFSGLFGALLILPLALGARERFFWMTVEVPLTQPVRLDAFSLTAWLKNVWGVTLPGGVGWMLTFGFVGAVGLRRKPVNWPLATALAYGIYFLTLKQAF